MSDERNAFLIPLYPFDSVTFKARPTIVINAVYEAHSNLGVVVSH